MKIGVLVIIALSSLLGVEGGVDTSLLKKEQKEILQAKKRQIELAKSIEQYSLLFTPSLSYENSTVSGTTSTDRSSINLSVTQDIFKSGGIYFTLKNATDKAQLNTFRWQQDRKNQIYAIYKQVIALKKIDLILESQTLQLTNKQLEIKTLEERYNRGLESISNLNKTLIALNNIQNAIYNTQDSKNRGLTQLKSITDKSYKQIVIPNFPLITKEHYLNKSHALKTRQLITKTTDNTAYITLSRYLPKLSLFANYNQNMEKDSSQTSYGFRASWVFNANTFKSIEYANLDTLQAKLQEQISGQQEALYFDTQLQKIRKIDQKIANKQKSVASYKTIIKNNQELYEKNLRTKDDVDSLINTQRINQIDIESFKLDKTLLMINLYNNLH